MEVPKGACLLLSPAPAAGCSTAAGCLVVDSLPVAFTNSHRSEQSASLSLKAAVRQVQCRAQLRVTGHCPQEGGVTCRAGPPPGTLAQQLLYGSPLCDIPSGCCLFTGPWTVTCSSLCMLCRVAAFCRPLRPGLLLVSGPHSRSPVFGVLGLC